MAFIGHTPPPFYSNEPENLHCGQACLRMVYEHFTGTPLTLADAEVRTDYHSGPDHFVPALLRFMAERGLSVTMIGTAPSNIFPTHALIACEDRVPEITDIIAAIADGALLLTSLNYFGLATNDNLPQQDYFGLYGENEKYSGHYVMIYDVDAKNHVARLHNPGLPAIPAQEISFDQLLQAMYSPRREMGNLIAIRKVA